MEVVPFSGKKLFLLVEVLLLSGSHSFQWKEYSSSKKHFFYYVHEPRSTNELYVVLVSHKNLPRQCLIYQKSLFLVVAYHFIRSYYFQRKSFLSFHWKLFLLKEANSFRRNHSFHQRRFFQYNPFLLMEAAFQIRSHSSYRGLFLQWKPFLLVEVILLNGTILFSEELSFYVNNFILMNLIFRRSW